MTQIEVSFSAFFTIFVHFWPILTQYFDLYSTKILFWAYFGTQGTPLAILHSPKSCLVALNGLKRAKNWLKLIFHFQHFSPLSSIFGSFGLNSLTCIVAKFSFSHFLYQWDTHDIIHIPKSCLVAFKRPINGPKFTQIEVSTSLFHHFHLVFGWKVLRWVAWTIWSDACLLDQITYVILIF